MIQGIKPFQKPVDILGPDKNKGVGAPPPPPQAKGPDLGALLAGVTAAKKDADPNKIAQPEKKLDLIA